MAAQQQWSSSVGRCCLARMPKPRQVLVPCPPQCCQAAEPLRFCVEFDRLSSLTSITTDCPPDASSFWACGNASGEQSALSSIQSAQVTLAAPYLDASAVRVADPTAALEPYDSYCAFIGADRQGPIAFGKAFQCPAVCESVHAVLVPCRVDESGVLAFCEYFVASLSMSVRPAPRFRLLSESTRSLSICCSIPWAATVSPMAWEAALARSTVGNFQPSRPSWRAFAGNLIEFWGSLKDLEGQYGDCDIWINDSAALGVPLTCSYASLPRLLAVDAAQQGAVDNYVSVVLRGQAEVPDDPVLSCRVTWAGVGPEGWFKSARTHCAFSVRGTGVIDGSRIAAAYGTDVLPLDQAIVKGVSTLGEVLRRAEYEILSGLLEIDADGTEEPAIDVRGLRILNPPKRYKSSAQLNGYNAWQSGGCASPKGAVHVEDLKIIGGWLDATDGPDILSPRSSVCHCLYHVADDAIKLGSSYLEYKDITLLQGNAGGAINIGNYGVLPASVKDMTVAGVYVQRVCQLNAQDDGLGGLVTSRNVCQGVSVKNCTIEDVHVPFLGGASVSATGVEVPVLGPNVYWRVSSLGFLVNGPFARPVPLQATSMDDINLLRVAPGLPPLASFSRWYLFYWSDASGAGSGADRSLATLGTIRLTWPPADKRNARTAYACTSCRIFTRPQDPLNQDYFVYPNARSAVDGVDSLWLQGLLGLDVPTNVSFQSMVPQRLVCPVRNQLP